MRFGETLVQAGALSREQLAKALEMQKILGGRLGTNLLELGYLDERTLTEHLGRFRSTQAVEPESLKKIPAPVLRSIPAKLALRYRLVPYQVRGKTLFVASKDPGDALQEDEISFLTSFMVRTHVALELHLEVALRRHFKAPLDQRFVALTRRMAAQAAGRVSTQPAPRGPASPNPAPAASVLPAPQASAVPQAPAVSQAPAVPRAPTVSQAPAVSQAPTVPQAPTPPQAPAMSPQASASADAPSTAVAGSDAFRNLSTPAPEMEFIELDADDLALLRGAESPSAVSGADPQTGTSLDAPMSFVPNERGDEQVASRWQEPVSELDAQDLEDEGFEAQDTGAPELGSPEPEGPPEDADLETRLMWAARELQAADIRDEIGDVLLGFAATCYRRRALVIRRKDELVGWMASGEGMEPDAIRELALAATAPSVFFGLQEPGSFWLGPLPPLPANRDLIETLGAPAPRDCLVLPISLRSKIVGYLYVDNLDEGVAGSPVAEMKRLVAKAGLAFEVYILKNKIRMM